MGRPVQPSSSTKPTGSWVKLVCLCGVGQGGLSGVGTVWHLFRSEAVRY